MLNFNFTLHRIENTINCTVFI